jgi:hypothetical protein
VDHVQGLGAGGLGVAGDHPQAERDRPHRRRLVEQGVVGIDALLSRDSRHDGVALQQRGRPVGRPIDRVDAVQAGRPGPDQAGRGAVGIGGDVAEEVMHVRAAGLGGEDDRVVRGPVGHLALDRPHRLALW